MFKYFSDFNVQLTSNPQCQYKFTLKQQPSNVLKAEQLDKLMNNSNSQPKFIQDLIN